MTHTVRDVAEFLEAFAPARLAEDWDNVGLLVGRHDQRVQRVMTCLTVTPDSVAEAVRERADLIVTHHPLPFRPLKRITGDQVPGRLLLDLIAAGIHVYSPHTAFDSAARGINQRLAEGLELGGIQPLEPRQDDPDGLGAGRWGTYGQPRRLERLAELLRTLLHIDGLHAVGPAEAMISRVAVACGAAGSFLAAAREAGCELLVTGETSFHTCLEAEATGVALLLPGHYASERFAVEQLAEVLTSAMPPLNVWASRQEHDPLRWLGRP
jgi:dinuclear metal center YbgI/SA1388 family protein